MIHTRNPIKPMYVTEQSYIPHLVAIAALWGGAMTGDYYDQERTRLISERDSAHHAAEIYESRIKTIEDCEAKRINGYYYEGRAFICPQEI